MGVATYSARSGTRSVSAVVRVPGSGETHVCAIQSISHIPDAAAFKIMSRPV